MRKEATSRARNGYAGNRKHERCSTTGTRPRSRTAQRLCAGALAARSKKLRLGVAATVVRSAGRESYRTTISRSARAWPARAYNSRRGCCGHRAPKTEPAALQRAVLCPCARLELLRTITRPYETPKCGKTRPRRTCGHLRALYAVMRLNYY